MKVLAIDGGGIRGLIPALVLAEIEKRAGRLAGGMFDLVAGTSTGAIIACALTQPNPMPAPSGSPSSTSRTGPKIFDASLLKTITSVGGLVDERYDASALVDLAADAPRRRAAVAGHDRDPDHRLRPPGPRRRWSCATPTT